MKIWSDKKYLRDLKDVRPILMPFWGCVKKDEPHKDRFDDWVLRGKSIYTFVDSMEDADVVVYPQDPTIDVRGFEQFKKDTQNKKMLVFFNSDSQEDINVRQNTILFRTSKTKKTKFSYEFGLPGWSEDWGKLPFITSDKPIVGFCGQDFNPKLRSHVLDILEKDNNIETNFIRKKQFWGGWINKGRDPTLGRKLRNEYINNLKSTEYCVCMRGGGNFSYRLYETMMSGRIPILINTDCILPYDFFINWNEFFPIIDANNINNVSKIVLNYHNKINHKERQQWLREVWEKYISPYGFFNNLDLHWEGKY